MRHPRMSAVPALFALGAVAFLASGPTALAGKPKAPKPAAVHPPHHQAAMIHSGGGYHHRNNPMANQNNGEVIRNLHATLSVLANAQHDYNGHRIKAMHEIGTAIHHLQTQGQARNQANPAASYVSRSTGAASKNAVPQATSDRHLRTAMRNLNQIGTYISGNGFAPNHARALASVQKATQELNTALAIR